MSDTETEKKDGQLVHLPIPPWAICKAGTPMRDPCIALRIPEEIWKKVAAIMSAAEWARVSGTSRALSRVQLETVILAPRCAAGIHWAAAHWGEAKTVALTIRGFDDQKMLEAAYEASEQGRAAAMQHVRHIALHLEAGSSGYTCFDLWRVLGPEGASRLPGALSVPQYF
ncbi:hypothetical protein COCOBI_09-0630 [Coccomyxa sp. Obi]|nr:hypothetical protein COCOBI_09-0630 [Coccomyxa sp. Obi]